MIDIQYLETRAKVKNLLIFYSAGFLIPFIYNNLSVNEVFMSSKESILHFKIRLFLYILATFTQISFLLFEFAEVK